MVVLKANRFSRFIAFALVGAIGFCVDTGLSLLFHASGLDPFQARFPAMIIAMFTTWRLNRYLTFRSGGTNPAQGGLGYALIAAVVAAVNYAIYSALLLTFDSLTITPAIVISTCLSMILSYLGYGHFAFQDPSLREDSRTR